MKTDRKKILDTESALTLGLIGLTFIAEDSPRLERFLSDTGIGPNDLRANATDPAFLASVLDYLLRQEPLLLVFAASKDIPAESVYPAHELLTEAAARNGRQ